MSSAQPADAVASPPAPASPPPPPVRAPVDEFRVEHTRAIHLNAQEMVKLADQKAQAFVATGAIVTALLGSNAIDRFRALANGLPNKFMLGSGAVTLALFVGAVLCAVAVLQPRFPGPDRVLPVVGAPRLLWASDIANHHRNPSDYVRALLAITPGEAIADLAYENLKLSCLLAEKWKWNRRAALLIRGALVAWTLTVVLAVVGG